MEHIILLGHGSPKKTANTLEIMAGLIHKAVHPGCAENCVRTAYLEFAEPGIMEAIKKSVEDGAERITAHPFFLSSGVHVTKDIPEIIGEARGLFPDVEIAYTEPLGIHENLVGIVLDRIKAAGFKAPLDIEKRSFDIISGETDLAGFPEEQVPVIKRVIHSTADFEFRDSLVFHPEAVKKAVEAIRTGRNILVDVEMVKAGINKKLLEKWGGKVICGISDEDVSAASEETGKTRAELAIEKKIGENVGIIAIGNAPTALLKTIEILDAASPYPKDGMPVVVGVPVGFVKALESKALLSSKPYPFITNLSRKGGSTVAAAIVNALLKAAEEK